MKGKKRWSYGLGILVAGLLGFSSPAAGDSSREDADPRAAYKIHSMIRSAKALQEENQLDRAEKLLISIPNLYPSHEGRFAAHLELGTFYAEGGDAEKAIKQFQAAAAGGPDEQRAEAQYRLGVAYYTQGEYARAFSALRGVTADFPGTVYANESFYYIGLCHFHLKRWSQAIDALEKVGTSLKPGAQSMVLAEAGHRLFVRLDDMDLVVLPEDEEVMVSLQTDHGDREEMRVIRLGRGGISYIGSIPTAPGAPVPGNDILEFSGGERVEVVYLDQQTEDGSEGADRTSEIRMVSSARIAFTDGAYRERAEGVFAGQPFFVRLKDHDADRSEAPDSVEVDIEIRYVEEDQSQGAGVDLREQSERLQVRDRGRLVLRETGPHTGVFTGSGRLVSADEGSMAGASAWEVVRGDEAVVRYLDEEHLEGQDPLEREHVANVLVGSIRDVRIEHRRVEDDTLRMRKQLIEARIFLKLGQVFKEVGLQEKAVARAEQGMDLVEEVIRTGLHDGMDRDLVEEAFTVKWELLLVQNRLNEAVKVCQQLLRLFPNTSLADQALLRIATARMAEGGPEAEQEAARIFSSLLRLPESDVKAEAQFRLAELAEKRAIASWQRVKDRVERPNMAGALQGYRACAERYPDSPFAADALEKISSYYIQVKDYRRAIELMEQVFRDYPDAAFLDGMLFKWTVAAYRLGQYAEAKEKVDRLLLEYPNSDHAEKSRKIQAAIAKKL